MSRIQSVCARQVLDSRGNPTVEVDVRLADGSLGRAMVPSGASTGAREAVELRDGDPSRWHGRGVATAVGNVVDRIGPAITGRDADNQTDIDEVINSLDSTGRKANLGANATLGASLAVIRAAAASHGEPLYRYLGGPEAIMLPVPMMNIVNGGAHADNGLDFQEFMIVPVGARTFFDAVRMGSEVFHTLKQQLAASGHSTNVGDEGGFAPNFTTAEQVLDVIVNAIGETGYDPGDDIAIALDPAASEFYEGGMYRYGATGQVLTTSQQIEYLERLVDNYPIVSLEDPLGETDHDGWIQLTDRVGNRCRLVGDDLFCTNASILADGIHLGKANSILVKLNQIGTLSEFLDAVQLAQQNSYDVVVSHRSGETEDTIIADIVVATGTGLIKTGSLSRSDRTAKYNQLIRIEEELAGRATYCSWALSPRAGDSAPSSKTSPLVSPEGQSDGAAEIRS